MMREAGGLLKSGPDGLFREGGGGRPLLEFLVKLWSTHVRAVSKRDKEFFGSGNRE